MVVLPLEDDNPATLRPAVTIGLIVICVAIYVWQHLVLTNEAGRAFELHWGLVPAALSAAQSHTLLTSMFLHLGFVHLAGNVLFLWVFGNNVEDAMGHVRFGAFYLLCGALVALVYLLANQASSVPATGASGAVSAVLGAYLLLYPRAQVALTLPLGFINVHLGRFSAVWVLAVWFLLQLVMGAIAAARAPGGGAFLVGAFAAHVAGFVVGIVLVTVFKRRDVPLWRRY
jgi:membrane associated rhomboid family serine protease